jgi:hypothetical protein
MIFIIIYSASRCYLHAMHCHVVGVTLEIRMPNWKIIIIIINVLAYYQGNEHTVGISGLSERGLEKARGMLRFYRISFLRLADAGLMGNGKLGESITREYKL